MNGSTTSGGSNGGRASGGVEGLTAPRAEGRAVARTVGRQGPLRVDAQRNLRLVLSAARDVFGEQGYGAPMEEVARRARVGVGTVYRKFPNKEALVRYIAEEETQRLTDSAREALVALEKEPWAALEGFVQRSAAAGTGRLLPPELLAASAAAGGSAGVAASAGAASVNVASAGAESVGGAAGTGGPAVVDRADWAGRGGGEGGVEAADVAGGAGEGRGARVPSQRGAVDHGTRELLAAVGQLVERSRAAGELRADVTVADLMLVIATTPPRLEDPARRAVAGRRLLELLLQGLRAPGPRPAAGD
ncbi:TetR/AcrR family transcriptional regulator [Streptomyces sp. 4N509B]|uniref:TetR/AcrR family transcriptional regulator n=1 Tax=Streptomyces sp. 4N509B TaxID=3457413 RepID=UPI003FD46CDA